jgi:hypothetical protein
LQAVSTEKSRGVLLAALVARIREKHETDIEFLWKVMENDHF